MTHPQSEPDREPSPARGPLYGAIEGGGTKIVCATGYSPYSVLDRAVIPTRDPKSTLEQVADFFVEAQRGGGRISALGVAFFGPLGLRRDRSSYGHILATPKTGWSGVDLVGNLASRFKAPIALDTDVAASALAELRLGAGRDVRSLAYVTVGTGIGAGFAPSPERSTRMLHPEAGHLRVRRVPSDDFEGICPFHGDCLEGLASGLAIRARWGCELSALPAEHPAWSVIGTYLGELAGSIALMVSVERIVFGGGVSSERLLPHIRGAARASLSGYVAQLDDGAAFDRYICLPMLGDDAGIAGAFLLAAEA